MCSVGTNSLLEGIEDEARRDDGVEGGFTLGVGTREKIKYRFCMKATMGDLGVESPHLITLKILFIYIQNVVISYLFSTY